MPAAWEMNARSRNQNRWPAATVEAAAISLERTANGAMALEKNEAELVSARTVI